MCVIFSVDILPPNVKAPSIPNSEVYLNEIVTIFSVFKYALLLKPSS